MTTHGKLNETTHLQAQIQGWIAKVQMMRGDLDRALEELEATRLKLEQATAELRRRERELKDMHWREQLGRDDIEMDVWVED